MRGRRWAVMAALVAAGRLSLSAHSTGSPAFAAHAAAGIAYSGALEGATTTELLGWPAAAVWSLSIACASAARVGALDVRGLRALDLGGLADPDDLGVAGLRRAGGAERVERGLRGVRHVLAVGEQHRRAQRAAHQLGGGDRGLPVLGVDERDRRGPGVARARGVDRLGDARGVGDRIGPAHARGVLRGESGKAEALGGLLVVAALADHRLALVGGALAAPAAAGGEHDEREQEDQRPAGHDRGHASRCPSRCPQPAAIRRAGRTFSSRLENRTITGWT